MPSPKSQELIDQAHTLTPTLGASVTPHPTATLDPTKPTPTPTSLSQTLSPQDIQDLQQYALGLINKDRTDNGLPPVTLDSNPAAQSHAEDMLDNDYIGHWWIDGRKPYMVYTQTGGTTYADENVASGGWTAAEWAAQKCGSLLVHCDVLSPKDQIQKLEYGMMYDDAGSNWGHRDNILRPAHTSVSIGVAANGRRTTFAEHFHGGSVQADAAPSLTAGGTLSFSLTKLDPSVAIANVVSVYYDPLPTPKTAAQIDSLHSYCLGGGFTADCVDSIATVLMPPPRGSTYSNLGPTAFIADSWHDTSTGFSFSVNNALFTKPGVYSIVVWRSTGSSTLTDQLVALSAWQE